MKIPTKLRYGLRFLINVAEHYGSDELIPISQVSKEENISNKYLEQIISSFVRAGIIKGSRGKGGGYQLVKDPAEISIYDVALAVGEDFSFVGCVREQDYCENQHNCQANLLWRDVSESVVSVFKTKTLSRLSKGDF